MSGSKFFCSIDEKEAKRPTGMAEVRMRRSLSQSLDLKSLTLDDILNGACNMDNNDAFKYLVNTMQDEYDASSSDESDDARPLDTITDEDKCIRRDKKVVKMNSTEDRSSKPTQSLIEKIGSGYFHGVMSLMDEKSKKEVKKCLEDLQNSTISNIYLRISENDPTDVEYAGADLASIYENGYWQHRLIINQSFKNSVMNSLNLHTKDLILRINGTVVVKMSHEEVLDILGCIALSKFLILNLLRDKTDRRDRFLTITATLAIKDKTPEGSIDVENVSQEQVKIGDGITIYSSLKNIIKIRFQHESQAWCVKNENGISNLALILNGLDFPATQDRKYIFERTEYYGKSKLNDGAEKLTNSFVDTFCTIKETTTNQYVCVKEINGRRCLGLIKANSVQLNVDDYIAKDDGIRKGHVPSHIFFLHKSSSFFQYRAFALESCYYRKYFITSQRKQGTTEASFALTDRNRVADIDSNFKMIYFYDKD